MQGPTTYPTAASQRGLEGETFLNLSDQILLSITTIEVEVYGCVCVGKPLQCLRALTMSSWNPPPGNRKMHGDLLYLNVMTIEDKELNITSSTRGFYINQSVFNFTLPGFDLISCLLSCLILVVFILQIYCLQF